MDNKNNTPEKITEDVVINPSADAKDVSEMTQEEKTEFFGITEDSVEEAEEKAVELEEEESAEELEKLDGAEEETEEEETETFNDEPPTGDVLGSLTLTYDLYDILDVIKIQEKSRLSLRIMTVAIIILPIFGVVTAAMNLIKDPASSPSTLILWILILLFAFYSYIIAPKNNAKRTFAQIDADQQAGNVSKFTVYEGGIQTESKFGLQTFYWSDFKEVHECDAGIVFVTHTRGPVFFSKRLMENFDRERLSAVLEQNFGKKYFICEYTSERNKEKK